MPRKALEQLHDAMGDVPDPRRQCKNLLHRLSDILVIGFCAVLCGCEDFEEIEDFGDAKKDFFGTFLELPNGMPSHDTFRRVFQAVNPQALQTCLVAWLAELRGAAAADQDKVIAIDGKTLRRTFDRRQSLGALHLVSAWATEAGLTLGQVAVEDKSNEIDAIPRLLELLELQGAVVTIDAAGCQKAIAEQIVAKEGDYVLALKGNQPTLHKQVLEYFERQQEAARPARGVRHERQCEQGHGRSETRDVWVAPVPADLAGLSDWAGLTSIALVVHETTDLVTGKITGEARCYISSLPPKVKRIAHAIRSHWRIENSLHWVLDVVFHEDNLRLRDRTAVQNLALLNRLAVSVLKQDTKRKMSIKNKRKTAGWNTDYLTHLLHMRS
jgi:predicted transposase YbfD/YdcC